MRAHRKGLELVCHVQPDVPDALVGDAGRLRQVLLNLVGNAIKFTEEGEVVVRVEVAGEPAPEEVSVRFAVSDTGIGIPPDKQEKIFRAFEQEDTSTTRKYGGTGLGLSIAARLVALMGGTIAVQSEPGRGSTFAFTARFGRQPHPAETTPALPPVLLRDLRVLVVDDNATNRHILEEWLRGWQMEPDRGRRRRGGHGRPLGRRQCRPAVPAGAARRPHARHRRPGPGRPDPRAGGAVRHPDHPAHLGGPAGRPGALARAADRRPPAQARPAGRIARDDLPGDEPGQGRRTAGGRAVPAREPGPQAAPAVTPLHILVAEDNEFSAQFLEQLLARPGHRVRLASNGREALALADEGGFDLLLLDVHMPELDGFQVVRAIRERERTAGGHLPVIALTARSRSEDRERCLAAGMDDFLTKPIRPAELLAAIDRLAPAPGGSPGLRPVQPACRGARQSARPRRRAASLRGRRGVPEGMCQDFQTYLPARLAEVGDALRDRDAAAVARGRAQAVCAAVRVLHGGGRRGIGPRRSCGSRAARRGPAPGGTARSDGRGSSCELVGGLSLEALRHQAGGRP